MKLFRVAPKSLKSCGIQERTPTQASLPHIGSKQLDDTVSFHVCCPHTTAYIMHYMRVKTFVCKTKRSSYNVWAWFPEKILPWHFEFQLNSNRICSRSRTERFGAFP